jgi:capsular exopolysaccharide synthesis family protein
LQEVQALLSQYESDLLEILLAQVNLQAAEPLSQINSVTLIELARLPTSPVQNEMLQNILFALAASTVVGAALAFGLEYVDFTIKSPGELQQLYGKKALAVFIKLDKKSITEGIITLKEPRSISAEAFRALRTRVQFSSVDKPIRSLVITSANPREGKTTIATNLAVVMAQAGKQVILVDTALRRPTIHKHFRLSNQVGFSSLLIADDPTNQATLQEHCQAGPVQSLNILTSGPIPPNPAELLSMEYTQQVQEALTSLADIVIYDTSPVVTVTDAAILASRADATIQVVRAGETRQDFVLKGLDILQEVGANVLGPVLNGVQQREVGYYYYYYNQYNKGTQANVQNISINDS